MIKKGFAEDKDFKHWSDIPEGMDERVHFVYCPECKTPMNIMRVMNPEDVALRATNKVTGYLGPQTER